MSLQNQIQQELDRFIANGPQGPPESIRIDGTGFRLNCEIAAVGSLGCAVNSMTVESDRLAGLPADKLNGIADNLANRLTYLLERVAPIEIDPEGCVVQLRSDPPHREGDERSYYELLVRRGGYISLHRYRKENRLEREPIAAQFTREVFGRLASDLVDALPE